MKKIIKIYLFIQFLFDTIVEIFIEKKKDISIILFI